MTQLSFEVWARVKDTLGVCVSSHGRVYREGYGIMKPTEDRRGYMRVRIPFHDGRRPNMRVHVLVAACFLGERPNELNEPFTVDHLDGDKKNNASDNLEYVTRRENHRRHFFRRRVRGVMAEIMAVENLISVETRAYSAAA